MTQTADSRPEIALPLSLKLALAVLAFYVCFLSMEAVHEFGHVLNAIATGGHIVKVEIPLIGTSQTFVAPNPAKLFVVLGGPVWGTLIPLLALAAARAFGKPVPEALKFFAAFCLIANGVYMGLGWMWPDTDAGELIRMDVPQASLICFGITATAIGLAIWHQLPWLNWRRLR